jgi:L-lactate dehydrogenase complex protein LldG
VTIQRAGDVRESGDRAAFLAALRGRLRHGVPHNPAHPLPPPLDAVPVVRSTRLDADDVVGSFVRNARLVQVVVHEIQGDEVPQALIDGIVERHDVGRAVVTNEPDAVAVGEVLVQRGITVDRATKATSALADLGITGAVAAIATTGSVVMHSGEAGGRTASLLPPVQLCVLRASRIAPSSAEVLRSLGDVPLPSNVVVVTGPSRSGDIEQIIALGVHGPVTVEVALLLGA